MTIRELISKESEKYISIYDLICSLFGLGKDSFKDVVFFIKEILLANSHTLYLNHDGIYGEYKVADQWVLEDINSELNYAIKNNKFKVGTGDNFQPWSFLQVCYFDLNIVCELMRNNGLNESIPRLSKAIEKFNSDLETGNLPNNIIQYWNEVKEKSIYEAQILEENKLLKEQLAKAQIDIDELRKLAAVTFDRSSPTYPPELHLCYQAWICAKENHKKGKPKETIKKELEKLGVVAPTLLERLATVANWDKEGGAPKTL